MPGYEEERLCSAFWKAREVTAIGQADMGDIGDAARLGPLVATAAPAVETH